MREVKHNNEGAKVIPHPTNWKYGKQFDKAKYGIIQKGYKEEGWAFVQWYDEYNRRTHMSTMPYEYTKGDEQLCYYEEEYSIF